MMIFILINSCKNLFENTRKFKNYLILNNIKKHTIVRQNDFLYKYSSFLYRKSTCSHLKYAHINK